MRQQQDNNIVTQLQAIVADKEAKVKQLEEEIKQCRLNVSGSTDFLQIEKIGRDMTAFVQEG